MNKIIKLVLPLALVATMFVGCVENSETANIEEKNSSQEMVSSNNSVGKETVVSIYEDENEDNTVIVIPTKPVLLEKLNITVNPEQRELDLTELEGVTNDKLTDLAKVPFIEKITISENYNITDITILKALKNLTYINISFTSVTDLSALSNLKNVEELNITNCKIKDISPIKNYDNLKVLHLAHSTVPDISMLVNLKAVEDLDITMSDVEDISILKDWLNLKRVKLAYSRTRSLEGLYNHEKLTDIDLVEVHYTKADLETLRKTNPNLKIKKV